MKTHTILFSFLLLVTCNITFAQAIYQRIYFEASPQQIETLTSQGVALDHLIRQQDGYVAELSQQEVSTMMNAGVKVEIITADLAADFKAKYSGFKGFSSLRDYTQPAHFHAGSMGGSLTYSQLLSELDSMKFYFPDLITTKASIGSSYEGRQIYMVKISDNPDTDEDEPEVEFDALHHAREPVSMMHLVYYMWWLLENYNIDSMATYLVNERETFFVPVVNPDGYSYNESTNPNGGGYWRKNMRDNGNGTVGVDLNRNYSFGWGLDSGSSGDGSSDVYRGTAAFSEPETQAMRDFLIAHNFVNTVSCHTAANVFIHPWGYQYDPCADEDWYNAFSERATRWSNYPYGNCYQMLNYYASGTTIDFNYGEEVLKPKTMSFTPETGYAFWPYPDDIPGMCAAILEQNILCTYLPNAIFTITSDMLYSSASAYMDIPFTVYNVGLQQGNVKCYLQSTSPYVIDDGDSIAVNNVDKLTTASSVVPIQLDPSTPTGTVIAAMLIADDGLIKDTSYTSIQYLGFPTQTSSPDVSLGLFPNPANDILKITMPNQIADKLEVRNEIGLTLIEKEIPSDASSFDLNVAELPAGIYMLTLHGSERDFVGKFVITHQ